jgi:PAS domain S-box-containing protein
MIDFFEFSNEMLCLADRRGYFTRVNSAWTDILGWPTEEFLTRPYVDFVHPDDLEATLAEARLLYTGNHETVWFENRYRCLDGTYRWLAWRVRHDPASDQLIAAARDITEQKQQAESLRVSEERLRLVMEATNDAIWDLDLVRGTVWWNETYVTCFGHRPQETATSIDWWIEHIHPEDRERVLASYEEAVHGDALRWLCEYRYSRTDGTYAYVLDRALITRDQQGRPLRVLGAMQDTTARKQAEEDLRAQAETIRHLFYIQERERKLVSYDIHDGLAQMLVGASMHVEAACGNPSDCAGSLEVASEILRKSIAESRRLINDLRPIIIDERGISDSIQHLIADYARHSDCEFDCAIDIQHSHIEPVFDGVVFRIVQESVANALRHGRATEIAVRIQQQGEDLTLEIRDNGIGFDLKQVPADRFGLRAIPERAKIFGGRAQIESELGQGTTVRVWLKIPQWREP